MMVVSDAAFVSAWERLGSAKLVAEYLGISERAVYKRRKRMSDTGFDLPTHSPQSLRPAIYHDVTQWTFPRELPRTIENGSIIISSDHHYWPGAPSVAHKALINVIKDIKPRIKILNGDVFDGGSIGRHPPFGWSDRPKVIDELHACQERVGEIEQALPRSCERLWTVGNHDIRFERNLAMAVPSYERIPGLRLMDHFPSWEIGWSIPINWDSVHPIMVKHRNAGGVHAGYNNAMKGGVTICTGHTHRLEVKPWGNYRCGRYYGVQTGTLADLDSAQFEYTENGPTDACPGFVVLTFKDGLLLPPELCEVRNNTAYFRGKVVAQR